MNMNLEHTHSAHNQYKIPTHKFYPSIGRSSSSIILIAESLQGQQLLLVWLLNQTLKLREYSRKWPWKVYMYMFGLIFKQIHQNTFSPNKG